MTLYCPKCKSPEIRRMQHHHGVTVLFGCMFSATFDKGLTDEKMQEILNDAERTGKIDEWLRKPFL